MTDYEISIDKSFHPPESLWQAIEPLLPEEKPKPKGGRPPQSNRKMFFAIFYLLKTGCQWKALPRALGCSSTVHDRFQKWVEAGVFHQLWSLGLLQCHVEGRLNFEWQSLDGCITKAPLGQQGTGDNPTDRGKSGTKRHLLTEAQGLPIGLVVTGANRHDKTQVQNVWQSMPFLPPWATSEHPQHFCADKAYDSLDIHRFIESLGYEKHILARGTEKIKLKIPGYRARRWVCERTHSWMNRFRRILIRWEKSIENYTAFLHLTAAIIVWKHSQVFG